MSDLRAVADIRADLAVPEPPEPPKNVDAYLAALPAMRPYRYAQDRLAADAGPLLEALESAEQRAQQAETALAGPFAKALNDAADLIERNPPIIDDSVTPAEAYAFLLRYWASGGDAGVGDGSVQPRQPPSGVNNPDVLGGLGV